jgi:hypothetical protein
MEVIYAEDASYVDKTHVWPFEGWFCVSSQIMYPFQLSVSLYQICLHIAATVS